LHEARGRELTLKQETTVIDWMKTRVLVTGGASFIGSALVDALLMKGARVRVADNFSSGKKENLARPLEEGAIELMEADLLDGDVAREAVRGMDIVFHLAADHGGRGYVDLHQAACASNLALDGLVFRACAQEKVRKVVFASSGCIYPNPIQTNPEQMLYLKESQAGPPYDADNLYGWAKLMGEMTLQAYYRDYGLKSVSCRYFTVYGPRGHENHAVMAMIARAFIEQNPFVVWGNGQQVRNWTYVEDIVAGTIRAAELVENGTAINLGTTERIRVLEAAQAVLRMTGHKAEIQLQPEMPTGPMNRVADNTLAKKLLSWAPEVLFMEGLARTIDWYFSSKDKAEVTATLESLLTERQAAEKPVAARAAAVGSAKTSELTGLPVK
jgi:nucleoside-diphosphate-sugar epimerase